MKTLTIDIMATLIPPWASTAPPYTYDATPTRCYPCTYDALYDYDDTRRANSSTSSTTVTTTFNGDPGFVDNGGLFEDAFGGHEQDTAGIGMSLYGYRYYKPDIGRWVNRDPAGELGGINLYLFCRNTPINIIDFLGLLTFQEAFDHYRNGPTDPNNPNHRTSLRMSFDEIDTSSVSVENFPKVNAQLQGCSAGTYQITWESSADNLPFTTSGDQSRFLGDISLKLEGTLTIEEDGDWSFSGTLKSFDDFHDYNASTHRGFLGEALTWIGRNRVEGKPYWIEIRGSKKAAGSGNCCAYSGSSGGGRGWY